MANYAIVIGIKDYNPLAGLRSLQMPVDDALRMMRWLLSTDGGNVAENNLKLLLNPIPDPIDDYLQSLKKETQATDEFLQEIKQDLQALKARGNVKPATLVEVMSSLNDLAEGASAGGERLFFYYAGHGLASRISFANEDAIVPADYRKNVLKPISFSSIQRFFQALPFPEQYIFLDCCRNLSISELDLDRAPPPESRSDEAVPRPVRLLCHGPRADGARCSWDADGRPAGRAQRRGAVEIMVESAGAV